VRLVKTYVQLPFKIKLKNIVKIEKVLFSNIFRKTFIKRTVIKINNKKALS